MSHLIDNILVVDFGVNTHAEMLDPCDVTANSVVFIGALYGMGCDVFDFRGRDLIQGIKSLSLEYVEGVQGELSAIVENAFVLGVDGNKNRKDCNCYGNEIQGVFHFCTILG